MSAQPGKMKDSDAGQRRLAAWLSLTVFILSAATMVVYYSLSTSGQGKPQPIPFSHKLHAGDKEISCLMCHTDPLTGERAGIPPLETCMLCHQHVIVDYPYIKLLREHYERREPVVWARVNDLPDFVFFDHSMHIMRGFDCGECHGNVKDMDRVLLAHKFDMGFCVQCHRDNGASHDCYICHR